MIILSALPGRPPLVWYDEHTVIDLRTGEIGKRHPRPRTGDMVQMIEDLRRNMQ